jgi:hypothetical protein
MNEGLFYSAGSATFCMFSTAKECSLKSIEKTRYNISLFKEACKRGDFLRLTF